MSRLCRLRYVHVYYNVLHDGFWLSIAPHLPLNMADFQVKRDENLLRDVMRNTSIGMDHDIVYS